jgi:hypothetical protein
MFKIEALTISFASWIYFRHHVKYLEACTYFSAVDKTAFQSLCSISEAKSDVAFQLST